MNNTKKLPTTGIKPAIESFFAISVCHFCNQSGCKGIIFIYHVTLSLNVLMVQNDILAEPPYGPLYGVTSGSKLGFVKASGHRKSLVTTGFL